MSNVLPKNVQKEVWGFYRSRILLVTGIAAIIIAVIAFLALLPSYMVTRMMNSSSNSTENTASELGEAEKERADVLRAREIVEELKTVSGQTATFEAFQKALDARPSGISIQKIQVTEQEGKHVIVISGNTSDRSKVSAYRSALSKISSFETVTVPVGALAGAEGGQFSITIAGAF